METHLIIDNLSCGGLISIFFYLSYKFLRKEINTLYGYRTSRNMKNKEIWDVANIYNIKLLLNFSLLTSIIVRYSVYTHLETINEI